MVPLSRFSNIVLRSARVTLEVFPPLIKAKSFVFLLHQISTSVLLNRVYATKMPIAQIVTVPIVVLVNKDILEMEQSSMPASLLPRL